MKIKNAVVACVFSSGILLGTPTIANVTYTYKSGALTVVHGDQPMLGDPFRITLTFTDDGSLIEWSAYQSYLGTFSSNNPFPWNSEYRPMIALTTSTSGQPTAWAFVVYTDYPWSYLIEKAIISHHNMNAWGGSSSVIFDAAESQVPPPDYSFASGKSSTSGVWVSDGVLSNLTFRYDPLFDHLYNAPMHDFTPPIPEPETYAMMLAGLGLLGVMTRRRKQKLNA